MALRKRHIVIITIFLCLFLSFIQINIRGEKVSAAANKKYLVLVQNYDGETFVAYEDIIDENLMVDVKAITKILDLDYEDLGKNKFRIWRTKDAQSDFTIGKKSFESIVNAVVQKPFKLKYAPVKKNNVLYFYYSSLVDLVKYKYYSSSKAKEFAKLGYDGIVCYSRHFSLTEIPTLDKVYNTKGKLFYPKAKKPAPTPIPAPEILPSDVDSKPANYLVLINGFIKSIFDDETKCFGSFKGLVETVDDHVMVNINLLTRNLYSLLSPKLYATNLIYHSIDANTFSITAEYNGRSKTSTLIFERGNKKYKQIFSDSKKVKYHTAKIAPYVSKHTGFDYIDLSSLKPLAYDYDYFNKFELSVKYYKAGETKSFDKNYKGYDGVVVINKYNDDVSLPDKTKIKRNYDMSVYSKFKLDKLPYIMINGVRIYGTDKFIEPKKQGGEDHDWGHYDYDLIELAYVSSLNSSYKKNVEILSYALYYDHMDNSRLWTLELTCEKDEYRLKIQSGFYTGLSVTTGQSSIFSYDDLAKEARNFLKAFLYKISSTPELLYDAILDSWLANEDRVPDNKFVVIGDAKVKFDVNTYEYVIKAAK